MSRKLEFVSPMKSAIRAHLANWWPRREKARALAQDYRAAMDEYPDVFADIARRSFAFDSTIMPGDPYGSHVLAGARDVWLHIETMADLSPADLAHLRERTEDNG